MQETKNQTLQDQEPKTSEIYFSDAELKRERL